MSYNPIEPQNYQQLLDEKCQHYAELFVPFDFPKCEVFQSKPTHYRLRAEFRVWHEGDDLYHIMFNAQDKSKIRIDNWLPASPTIYKLMPILIEKVKQQPILRQKLFQIDYLSTLSGEILVSMLYHRQLCDKWQQAITELKAELGADSEHGFTIDFIGRARKQKIVLGNDYVNETLTINGESIHYQQVENSFTQPNGEINQHMIEWAIDVSKDQQGDLLELYCGNGNFSLALAKHFDKVLATEIAKSSVDSAQINIARNNINNVTIARMAAEDFSAAIKGEREFRRLKDIDLGSYDCQTILVDPPRSGLDKVTEAMVAEYDNIIYISCNPNTLKDNLETLCSTHKVTRFAMFDQFPYTEHMECGVYLQRKSA